MRNAALLCLTLLWPVAALGEPIIDSVPSSRGTPDPQACGNYQQITDGVVPADCQAAIRQERDDKTKSVLLTRRAFIEDAPGDFAKYPAALADLDEALRLFPDNAGALHERAYLYNEYGRWAEARADLDKQLALTPGATNVFRERAMSLFHLGELQAAYDDRNSVVQQDPSERAYYGRADAAMWLGRFDAARADLEESRRLALAASDMSAVADAEKLLAKITLWTTTSADGPKGCSFKGGDAELRKDSMIGDCTRAFLNGATPTDRSEALTARSTSWLLHGDHDAFIEDAQIAAAVDPTNADMLANLGSAYVGERHSTAALPYFDAAIKLKPHFVSYAGRAQARLNLNDLDGAEADAKRANALQPNGIAMMVLGDVEYARNKLSGKAKEYWLEAAKLGMRDDGLRERLKLVGADLPAEDAK